MFVGYVVLMVLVFLAVAAVAGIVMDRSVNGNER